MPVDEAEFGAGSPRTPIDSKPNLLHFGASALVPKVVASALQALLFVVTARSLGPDRRGQLSIVVIVVLAVTVLFGLEVVGAGRFLLVGGRSDVDPQSYTGLVVILACVEIVMLVPALVLCRSLDVSLRGLGIAAYFGYGSLSVVGYAVAGTLTAYGRARAVFVVEGCASLISLLIVTIPSVRHSVGGVLLSLGLGQLFYAGVCLWVLGHDGRVVRPRFSPEIWKRVLRFSVPLVGSSIGFFLVFSAGRYSVVSLGSSSLFGIYTAAVTASEGLRIVSTAASPLITHRVAVDGTISKEVVRLSVAVISVVLMVGVTGIMLAPFLLPKVFGQGFLPSVPIFRILVLGELCLCVGLVAQSILFGRGQTGRIARSAASGLVVAAAVVPFAAHRFRLEGAAWGTVLAFLGLSLASVRSVRLDYLGKLK